MQDIPVGHRFALLGAALVVLGAYGPWVVGTRVEEHVMAPDEPVPFTRTGAGDAGWLLALPAALALAVLVAPLRPIVRSCGALVLLGVTLVVAGLAVVDPIDFPRMDVRVFERFEDVRLGWGLLLASGGAVMAFTGALVEAVRAPRAAAAPA